MNVFYLGKIGIIGCLLIGYHACYSYKQELAICSIFQNEARFFKEWLEFHKLVGVQHFYLYNNNSTDNYKEILAPYIQKGEIDVYDWPETDHGLKAQLSAFNDCLTRTRNKVKWVAFLDLDEFLFPVSDFDLKDVLKEFEECAQVSVNWFMFGTSNIAKIPDNALMIECLTKCDPKGNKHVKSIVRPERVKSIVNPHYALCLPGFVQVNPEKKLIHGFFSPEISSGVLRINHYWTRDRYHLETIKIARVKDLSANHMVLDNTSWYIPRAIAARMTAAEWILAVHDHINLEDDLTIGKFITPLKEKMGY